MIRQEQLFSTDETFDYAQLGQPRENVAFFDIETTGLSAARANLYLIGLVVWDNVGGSWKLIQLFSEGLTDEPELLRSFFALLEGKRLLLSFNGDSFDIPFLTQLLQQYALSFRFDHLESLDLYKLLRPVKKMLQLPNCKLKTCEQFLGIDREDRFSGGELIYVYLDYLKQPDAEKLELLLLHNAEDLMNLPRLLPMLSYAYLPSASFRLLQASVVPLPTGDGQVLDLHFESEISIPKPLHFEQERFTLCIEGNRVNLCVRLFEGELKFFYPDYKNYWYLPVEDTAIHSSVAEFVDKTYRIKATAKTAYQRKTGLFLPQLTPIFTPVFYKEYKGKVQYALYHEAMFQDTEKAAHYLREFLKLAAK